LSDNYLRLISTDPAFVPSADAAEHARARLAALVPEADEVTVAITEKIEFVDQGGNFERALCPRCGDEVDSEWWADAVDDAYENGCASLDARLPAAERLSRSTI
jgi:hypothetical protein